LAHPTLRIAMSGTLLAVQVLNGLQLGVLLFLVAAGLTLVFGVMDFLNLAHGVQYMLGAYLAVAMAAASGSFVLGLLAACVGTLVFGLLLDRLVFRFLYGGSHLDQVLATFGLILTANEAVRMIWGNEPLSLAVPDALSGSIALTTGLRYPVYRLVILAAGLLAGAALAVVVSRTRIGMQLRAGATHPQLLGALGVDTARLFALVTAGGAMLAGFAGAVAAPILSVEPGMGDGVLILAFVVIIIGGTGSIRGAAVAALLVGLVDTLGRSFATDLMRLVLRPSAANTAGPALASMAIYVLMAVVLAVRPAGLLPAK
jgi:branched-chain amino acid transport system permease protein